MNEQTDAQKHFQLGQKAFEKGKYDIASAEFQKAIKIAPKNADFHYWLGRTFFALDKNKEAIANFKQCSEIKHKKDKYADAYYWWGNTLYFSNKEKKDSAIYEAAAEKYDKSIKQGYKYKANAYYMWGNSLYFLGRYPEAIKKYQKSIDLGSKYEADAYYRWGNSLHFLGRYPEAIEKYQTSIDLGSKRKVDVYYRWGDSLYCLDKYEEAEKKQETAIKLLYQKDIAEVHYWTGVYFEKRRKYKIAAQKYEKCIEKYEQWLQKDPSYIDVHYFLGRVYYYLGDDDQAEIHLDIFMKKYIQLTITDKRSLKEFFEDSHRILGLSLYIKKRFPEAERAFQEYLNTQDSPKVLFEKNLILGKSFLSEIKQYEKATNYFTTAIKILNKSESSIKKEEKNKNKYIENLIEVKSFLSLALQIQKKYDLALEQYEEIIDLLDNNSERLANLSEKDIRSNPRLQFKKDYLAESYFQKGLILGNQRLYDFGVESLEEALKYSDNSAFIYREKANIYRQQGKYQKRWDELEEAVKKYEQEIKQMKAKYQQAPTFIDPTFIVNYWHTSLGNIYHQFFHDYDKAEKIYHQGLELDPNNENILRYLTSLYLTRIQNEPKNQDELTLNCQYYLDATKYYEKSLEILERRRNRLGDYSSLIDLGNFLLITKKLATQEEYSQTESYFLEAIEKDPKNAVEAYTGLGIFYLDQNSIHKAVDYFKKAHENDLGDFNVWSNLAETYLKQNKLKQAEKAFKDILAINPNHLDSIISLGQVYLAMGDAGDAEMYHQAIYEFDSAQRISSDNIGSSKLKSSEFADLHYLQGYANFQIYQNSHLLQKNNKFLGNALNYFEDALSNNSRHSHSKRAKEKIDSNIKASSSSTTQEQIASGLLTFLSLAIFTAIQILCFVPQPNNIKQDINDQTATTVIHSQTVEQDQAELTRRVTDALNSTITVTEKVDNSVIEVDWSENPPVVYISLVTDKKVFSNQVNLVEKFLEKEIGQPFKLVFFVNEFTQVTTKETVLSTYMKLGSPEYITLTFGSLIFAAIFAFLPRISKLSVGQGGVDLEKSSLQQISIGDLDNLDISKLIISRPIERKISYRRSKPRNIVLN
ncbi:MAG: tetratricopeptide repeat protein [Xenococcus sp. MO_188.B8]|nr:tetratricopeptide repeat protein [Xenococcus sp. MO_188.B8]